MLITLLPYGSFRESAKVLSKWHLKIMVPNSLEVLNILHEVGKVQPEQRNSRIALMWRGHEVLLCEWVLEVLETIERRGIDMPRIAFDKAKESAEWHMDCASSGAFNMHMPWWMGEMRFHIPIQSLLLRMDPNHYRQFFPAVPNDLEVFWPVNDGSKQG